MLKKEMKPMTKKAASQGLALACKWANSNFFGEISVKLEFHFVKWLEYLGEEGKEDTVSNKGFRVKVQLC